MNEITLGVIFLVVLILIIVIIFALYQTNKRINTLYNESSNKESILLSQITSLSQSFDQKLSETNQIIQSQLNLSIQQLQNQSNSYSDLIQKINQNNSKVLQELTEKLVKFEDTNKQVVNFAQQLQSIQNIFKNPKQRGIIGEYFLETILSNVLPQDVFQMQYRYKNGLVADAVIFIKDKIIPIDSKFSTDSYSKIYEASDPSMKAKYKKDFINDVKKRIDETSKYVSKEEDTIDVAFMFVPSDAVYNEIVSIFSDKSVDINLVSYSFSKKVVIVSPTSFFAYLQTVLLALNTIKMEGHIDEIIQYLAESTKYLKDFEESINKLGKNISTLVNAFNNAASSGVRLSKRLAKLTNDKKNIINVERISNTKEKE